MLAPDLKITTAQSKRRERMAKATYHIRESKNAYHFSYSGDLQEVINKAERDLQRERDNPEIERWKWIQEKQQRRLMRTKEK